MPRPLARLTPTTLDVLEHLLDHDAPTWGLAIAGATGHPTGSVYPILERLESHEWVLSAWEADGHRSGARRRLYRLTPDAREAAAAAVRARATATPRGSALAKPALGGAA